MVMLDLRNLYVAVCEKEVKVSDVNFKDFHAKLYELEIGIKNYQHYYRQLKQKDIKSAENINEDRLKYNLQKII